MNIKQLMTDDVGKVAEFAAACDDMYSSQYILAEGKIIKILQIVALSTVLQKQIGDALNGFDYGAAARKCLESGDFTASSPKEQAALAFCILADIDSGKIKLNDFLRKFFYKGDINVAYSTFCETLVLPFKKYIVDEPIANKDFVVLERKAMNLADAIENCKRFSQNEKEEYIFMCDNIATEAHSDLGGARALAIALKRLLSNVPELAPFVTDLIGELG